MYGYDTEPHRIFRNRPNANICEGSAQNSRVPNDMLGIANHIWRATHPHKLYGAGSYKQMVRRTHFDQSLGLVMSTAIVSHLLRARKRTCTVSTICTNFDDDTASTASTTTTTFLPIIVEERPVLSPLDNTNVGTLNLSQETLSEHFCDAGGLTSHAQRHNCEMQPMDTLVTDGSNWQLK